MPNAPAKVLYQGKHADFNVFIDSEESWNSYKKDSTVPLSDVVSLYKIFSTRTGGNEGVLDEASKQQLENEFGTTRVEDAILKILKQGTLKSNVSNLGKKEWASTNDSKGAQSASN